MRTHAFAFRVGTLAPLVLAVLMIWVAPTGSSAASAPDATRLQQAFPGIQVSATRQSAVSGWWEVVLDDGQVLYIDDAGTYLMAGNLVDLRSRANLTEQRRDGLRRDLLSASMPVGLFEYPAADTRAWVTVVTDIDCPYCRHLHQQMADYHAAGIGVRYLMMPRAGIGSPSYRKAVGAACADRPEETLTAAMNGTDPEPADCSHNIDEQFELARSLRVTGTPAIIADSGRMISGFVPAERLAAELGLESKGSP